MKLNIACGKQTWAGFFCVDAVKHPKATRDPDLLHAFTFDGDRLVNPLPLEDACASEVHSYHFIEHVYWWEAPAVVAEFFRLLKPGGKLVLELPNLALAAANLVAGKPDQLSMWGLYGDPSHRDPFMCHKWGWTPNTLPPLLEAAGFVDVQCMAPIKHGARVKRDMRAEARKL